MRRRILLWAVGACVAGAVVFVPWGELWLHRGIEGPPCVDLYDRDDLDFTSEFPSENRFVNGSKIRSLAGDPSPDCTMIGQAYRCDVPSDTAVEIELFDYTHRYEAPQGSVIYGNARFADCFIPPDAGA